MKDIEIKLRNLVDSGERVLNAFWFSNFKSCDDVEKEFKKLEMQKGFIFDDEPLKDCFCKI